MEDNKGMNKLIAVTLVLLASCVSAEAQYRHHHRGGGGGFAGGIIGGVIGGVLGGAIFAPRPYYEPPVYYQPPQPQPYYQPQPGYVSHEQIAYCMRRFRSYNPQTGVYFGYDGRYHSCP